MKSDSGLLRRIAAAVVDRRNLVFLFYVIAVVFSAFSMNWVKVENNIVSYLAKDSKTRKGITVMDGEFTTFAMADIMISNISLSHASSFGNRVSFRCGSGHV